MKGPVLTMFKYVPAALLAEIFFLKTINEYMYPSIRDIKVGILAVKKFRKRASNQLSTS